MKFQSKLAVSVGVILGFSRVCHSLRPLKPTRRQHKLWPIQDLLLGNVQTKDPFLVNRIKDAVNGALTAKGWRWFHRAATSRSCH